MPEIEQKELDTLKADAGKVDGLTKDLATANESITKATASYTTLEDSGKATTEELDKLKTVSDEQLNAKAAGDAELTKLRAAAEKYSVDENALISVKAEKDTVEKELKEFKDAALTSTRERLHALGVTEDDTKDKDIVILNAMEAGAVAVKGSGSGTGTGTGLNGIAANPPAAPTDALAQNLAHIEKLRANPRGGARKVG